MFSEVVQMKNGSTQKISNKIGGLLIWRRRARYSKDTITAALELIIMVENPHLQFYFRFL